MKRLISLLIVTAALPSLAWSDEPVSAVGPLMKLYQSGRLPAERQPAVVEMICNRGNEHDLRVVFDKVLAPEGMPEPLRLKTLGWLNDTAHTRKLRPTGDLGGLAQLVRAKNLTVATAAIRLAATLSIKEVSPDLRQLAGAADSSPEIRQAAIEGLAAIGGTDNQAALLKLAGAGQAVPIRMRAVAAVVEFDVQAAAREAADLLNHASADDDPAVMLDAFLEHKSGSAVLAQALPQAKLHADVAKRALRYMYSVGRNDAELSNVLSAAAGVVADPPPPTQDEVAELVREVLARGDAARGEKIFRRADLSCMRCHSVSRAGGQVGPELSAVGGSSPVDYMVNAVLNPNLAVKEQFVTRIFETTDGKVLTGIVIDRDESRVRFRDAQGKTIVLPVADIEAEAEGKSMMPAGLTKFLTKGELLDLIRFVSELGKPGPYAVQPGNTIQRWRVLVRPSAELTDAVPHLEQIRELLQNSNPEQWSPAYSQVAGVLPLDELRQGNQRTVVYLRGEVQVNEPGPVAVKLETGEPTHLWIDAVAFDDQKDCEVTLEPGRHQILVRVEISNRPAPGLKVQLTRPAGSTAQWEIVGGS
ncbi:MAG: HEAT repeat domain-containing protein [Planctomycetes bacterium]|nr:HEAT repeat domain-containing protein [Planctomycetota bacterium]